MGSGRIKPLIYIVDDQALLLDLAEVAIQGGDYDVRTFQNPEQALQCCRESSRKPDLLITDYAMDTMTGLDLIQHCVEVVPNLKTIVVSGTMGAEVLADSIQTVHQFLAKPYQPESLAQMVRDLLNA